MDRAYRPTGLDRTPCKRPICGPVRPIQRGNRQDVILRIDNLGGSRPSRVAQVSETSACTCCNMLREQGIVGGFENVEARRRALD